jgi:Flp pilus assembly protein TadG
MFKKLIELLRSWQGGCERGSMAVEFALAVPVLIALVLGAADYGALMNTSASLRGATRAAAEYAKANWNNPLVTNVTTEAEQQACSFLGLTLSGGSCSPVTPSVSTSCTCVDGTSVSCPSSGSANPCVVSNPTDPRVLVSVTVTATQSFNPMFHWASFAFPSTVSTATTVRTQ